MKKLITILATFILVGSAAAVTNYFPNGKFDSPSGAAGAWVEANSGTTTYGYPTSGGNLAGYGVMTNAGGAGNYGIWVGGAATPLPLASYGLTAGQTYTFILDMKRISGTNIGGIKIESWGPSGQIFPDSTDMRPVSGSGAWVTYAFTYTLNPGSTGIKVVPLWGTSSVVGYDNIGVIVPNTPLTVSITSPLNSAIVTSNFTIDATATVIPGTVTNVAFYDGPALLGNDTSAPFSFNVIGAALGAHALSAVARSSGGISATSAVVTVTVSNTPAPAGWQLAWADEFDGTSVDSSKWTFDIGNGASGWGNNEKQYYTSRPTNVFVTNGFLNIVARKEVPKYLTFDYTSAKLKTQGLYSRTYGRFEFRARVPAGKGYWPALWMMPAGSVYGGWAASGEIDVMENKGRQTNVVSGAIHYGGQSPSNTLSFAEYTLPGGGVTTDFHIYMVEWSTNSIKWYVDGVLFQTRTSWYSTTNAYPAPFDQSFYLIMNLAIGGNFDGDPDGTTVFPGIMQVDYARVYTNAPVVTTAPATPTGFTTSPGSAKVYLKWNAVSGATAYNVKRATNSGGPFTTVASPATDSFTDSGVANCSTYYYVVAATNSVGTSTNSSEQIATLGAYSLAVNSGGSAAGHFVADTTYVLGGTIPSPTSAVIDTSGVTNPAPQAVYQAERYGNMTNTFTGLIAGATYKVRLHFAETFWTAVGQRRFNVLINGAQVLTNYDIFAAANGQNRAVVREFSSIPNGSGQIIVAFTVGTADQPKASGIELILSKPASPAGLAATPGNSQVTLNWNALTGASYNVKRSLSSGGPFTSVASGLTSTNFVDSALTNGVIYHYVASASLLGCESTNSAFVSATPICTPPSAPSAGNNGPLWKGMTLNLTASTVPGATYSWTGPNGFNSTSQNPSIAVATMINSGLFSVTAAAGGCSSTPATTTVIVNPPASISIQAAPGSVILTWPGGILQQATNVSGPWSNVAGSTSPRTNPVAAAQEFYRLRLQ